MSKIVCVRSEATGKVTRAKVKDEPVAKGDYVIVENELGGDLGLVVAEDSVLCENNRSARIDVQVMRKATEEDIKKFEWLKEKEKKAFQFCLERIKAHNLDMKLVRVRYFFNEKKGIFYYTADGRIDFRELVKDLAKELRMRIEMRQVGVRDEARMVGGLGVCGRTLCCFSFIKEFTPVTIQKARNQQLVINPTKISGLCGRLMCCLAFEEETQGRMFIHGEEDYLVED